MVDYRIKRVKGYDEKNIYHPKKIAGYTKKESGAMESLSTIIGSGITLWRMKSAIAGKTE
ncbi:hypothetical protein ACOSZF_07815 [Cytobacillus firmus]|uniref:hypothetical protein n=1 Tax=Cytobacillus firmus TaxID=1399 RepID=UPI0015805096|nr:hypothetical protein [Cytobacillus firmus]MBG9547561.1 hypothetical protein [Cytobacillus firmus]MBG9604035.1 hypothetical protein [Cytobacillus firmus]MDD9311621.1 hypothetical protein [Cytobacillus firmus]MED1943193.1 hypothetical protein [Cytobacillus firmus]NUH83051.1 hypothetical protein [Cytobacillus firmus]